MVVLLRRLRSLRLYRRRGGESSETCLKGVLPRLPEDAVGVPFRGLPRFLAAKLAA